MSEVIPDIAGLIGCYVGIALLAILIPALTKLEQAGNFSLSIPHIKTFHVNVGTWIWGGLISSLTDAQKSLQHWAVRFEQDIATMFEVLVALPILAAEGSYKGLQALWTVALKSAINPVISDVRNAIASVKGEADYVYHAIHDTGVALPDKLAQAISSAASGAYANARSYTDALRSDVVSYFNQAKAYTDDAVSGLRRAEDAAISAASSLAQSALDTARNDFAAAERDAKNLVDGAVASLTDLVGRSVAAGENAAATALSSAVGGLQAGIAAVDQAAQSGIQAARSDLTAALSDAETTIHSELAGVLSTAETDIAAAKSAALAAVGDATAALQGLITQAEQLATSEVSQASSVASQALAQVRGIAVTAEDDVSTIVGKLTPAGVAALLGTIPALATFINTLAQETGLENEGCRGKVKNICATDPAAWQKLLAGAGFLALAFDFKDFVNAAELVAEGIGKGVEELEKPFDLSLPPLAVAA